VSVCRVNKKKRAGNIAWKVVERLRGLGLAEFISVERFALMGVGGLGANKIPPEGGALSNLVRRARKGSDLG